MLYFRDFPPTAGSASARGAACAGAGDPGADNAGEMRTLGHWTREAVSCPGSGNMAAPVTILPTLLLLRSVPPPTTLLCVTFMEISWGQTQDVKIDVIVIDVVDR